MRLGIALATATLVGCGIFASTQEQNTRPPAEICDDGIDNDRDGLADCDDTDSCGGLACRTTTGYVPDTSQFLPNADILYSVADCCDFEFNAESCPSIEIGTITMVNRASEEDGEYDVNCDLVDGESPVQWRVEGATEPVPFVVNQKLFADDTTVVTAVFLCDAGVATTFTTTCRANLQVGDADSDEIEFEVTGTAAE